jgi:hypothetical protein
LELISLAGKNGIKIFSKSSKDENLDVKINNWIEKTNHDNQIAKILNSSITVGDIFYKPGTGVLISKEGFVSIIFEFPNNYVAPSSPTTLSNSSIDVQKKKYSNSLSDTQEGAPLRKTTLNWVQPTLLHGQREVEEYIIYFKEDSPGSEWRALGKTTENSFQVKNLVKDKTYNFKVSAVDIMSIESSLSLQHNIIVT